MRADAEISDAFIFLLRYCSAGLPIATYIVTHLV